MDQVKFVEDSLEKIWSDVVGHFKFYILLGHPQILLGSFLNNLAHITLKKIFPLVPKRRLLLWDF